MILLTRDGQIVIRSRHTVAPTEERYRCLTARVDELCSSVREQPVGRDTRHPSPAEIDAGGRDIQRREHEQHEGEDE